MIIKKTPFEIDAMAKAGELSAKALRIVGAAVAPGISTLKLDRIAEEVIRQGGGIPAFKGYGGFPGSICASVNEQIVHGIPAEDVVLQEGDIISIDTGAQVGGWVGDNAWTFPVGKIDSQKQRLLAVTEKCMWAGIDAARPGNHLGDVGHAIQTIAEQAGYGVVREYVGHGVGRAMHEEPNVPNYGHRHTGVLLEPGMVLAIEPMINMGTRKTKQMPDGWLVITRDRKPSAHFEKTVAITEEGPRILTTEPDYRRPVE
jgi:methionyl aminopeptidase